MHKLLHNKSKPVSCTHCDRTYLSQNFLNQHINNEHNDNSPVPSTSRAIDLEVNIETDDESLDSQSNEINLTEQDLSESIAKLFVTLIDKATLKSINYSNIPLLQALDQLIEKYGHNSIKNTELDEQDLLRANLNLLFNIMDEDNLKNYIDRYSVDEVLIYLIDY